MSQALLLLGWLPPRDARNRLARVSSAVQGGFHFSACLPGGDQGCPPRMPRAGVSRSCVHTRTAQFCESCVLLAQASAGSALTLSALAEEGAPLSNLLDASKLDEILIALLYPYPAI